MANGGMNLSKFEMDFAEINEEQKKIKAKLSTKVGEKYKAHNQYPYILPYDETRVTIKEPTDRYINASLIKGLNNDKVEYIASQGPKDKEAAENFWLMVWEYNTKLIIMLTNLIDDNGIEKCVQYWPHDRIGFVDYGKMRVELDSRKCVMKSEHRYMYIEQNLSIQKIGDSSVQKKVVKHLQYLNWTENEATDIHRFHSFFSEARDEMHKVGYKVPILVHSCAGVGRTGTFITLDLLMRSQSKIEDIKDIIKKLRACRMSMVMTVPQLKFIHEYIEYVARKK